MAKVCWVKLLEAKLFNILAVKLWDSKLGWSCAMILLDKLWWDNLASHQVFLKATRSPPKRSYPTESQHRKQSSYRTCSCCHSGVCQHLVLCPSFAVVGQLLAMLSACWKLAFLLTRKNWSRIMPSWIWHFMHTIHWQRCMTNRRCCF